MSDSVEKVIDPDEVDETISLECPNCGNGGEVPASWKGLQTECKECSARFTAGQNGVR